MELFSYSVQTPRKK